MKRICKHLSAMILVGVMLLYGFFYLALPQITNHKKIVQVPDLTGKQLEELDNYLKTYDLQYVITDNITYDASLPAFSILQQFPAAGAYVKKKRKIYLTLNAENPPLVHMPNLIDGSVRQAQLYLKNKGLKLGRITYVPDITKHTVLEQWHNNHPIAAGTSIYKSSIIDIVVSAGLGKECVEVPDVLDKPFEEANLLLLERGMRVGIIHYIKNQPGNKGNVIQQHPEPTAKVALGTSVTLWVNSF